MSYDEVEIEDMTWNEKLEAYTYPCPCGDFFAITLVSFDSSSCMDTHFASIGCGIFQSLI